MVELVAEFVPWESEFRTDFNRNDPWRSSLRRQKQHLFGTVSAHISLDFAIDVSAPFSPIYNRATTTAQAGLTTVGVSEELARLSGS